MSRTYCHIDIEVPCLHAGADDDDDEVFEMFNLRMFKLRTRTFFKVSISQKILDYNRLCNRHELGKFKLIYCLKISKGNWLEQQLFATGY